MITMLWLYIARNFAKIVGLECPEPLANLYNRAYFRATWITTAMDAGFWTAMKIKNKKLRDLASMVFTLYYLVAAEQADEKVRKVRGTLTVDHLRVSWNKGTTPYLAFFSKLLRPKLARYQPRKIRIARPSDSSYKDPVSAWLYYDAPFATIKRHTKMILDIPGGGFVAMDPRTNDDKLFAWAGRTGLPILSLDYKKAPEYPYPYALNECYDVYRTLMISRGRCIGMLGNCQPRVILTGDSAGGNLATGTVLMIIQSAGTDTRRWPWQDSIPIPDGLILMYPGLDMNIGNWMSDEQMSLIHDRRTRTRNRNILRRKSEDYYKLDPGTPHHSDDEDQPLTPSAVAPHDSTVTIVGPTPSSADLPSPTLAQISATAPSNISSTTAQLASSKPRILKTRLAMSSMISYFNDRILTPEMMRAMIILYIGPHNRPDFSTDFLLSPLLAPEAILAQFPKTYFLTGERDPLVDDTVIFAGRLRQAHQNAFLQRQELGLVSPAATFDEHAFVEVALIPGISHGFLQFVTVFPEGWRHIFRCARWMEEAFAAAEGEGASSAGAGVRSGKSEGSYFDAGARNGGGVAERHHARVPSASSGEEDRPLEMTPLRAGAGAGRGRGGTGSSDVGAGIGKGKAEDAPVGVGGRGRRGTRGNVRRQRSMVSLASSDDLLGKRMQFMAGGLLGMSDMPADTP
jgi:acetyl esterase/lipase